MNKLTLISMSKRSHQCTFAGTAERFVNYFKKNYNCINQEAICESEIKIVHVLYIVSFLQLSEFLQSSSEKKIALMRTKHRAVSIGFKI